VEVYDVSNGNWAFGSLSSPRIFLSAASLQNKVFFAGGSVPDRNGNCCVVSPLVDIYDMSTGSWSQAMLSEPRSELGIAAGGNKILFAGGTGHSGQTGGYFSSRVDIYDVSTGQWSVAELSEARSHPYAAAAGDKILFAGGRKSNSGSGESKVVDIYDVTTGTWSTSMLSTDREGAAIAAVDKKIMIAGGHSAESGHLSSADVYDAATGKWETLQLSEARMQAAAAAAGNKLLVAGGISASGFSKTVDIFTLSN
jgi:N-acetylneuraminic acid mutarotase